MRVFVTGGTGLVGTRLIRRLRERRDDVVVLTRRPAVAHEKLPDGCTIVEGDPMQTGTWMEKVAECNAVVNLAGENIFARRWNNEFKALLCDSRVKTTENVVRAMSQKTAHAAGSPNVLVNASAIGYYGPCGAEEIAEETPAGHDTLAAITVAWEQAAQVAVGSGIRVVMVRIGIVLDKAGGALAQMLTPFKIGLGGPIGSGQQWMSWIHYHDLAGIMELALDNAAAAGPINGTSPNPVTNQAFSKALGRVLHRPSFMRVPGFALKLRFGQVAEVLTTGQRVLPQRALALGYPFKFSQIDTALQDVLA